MFRIIPLMVKMQLTNFGQKTQNQKTLTYPSHSDSLLILCTVPHHRQQYAKYLKVYKSSIVTEFVAVRECSLHISYS